jgi:glycosyltransferase involved in cell wall biosynthesis
MTAAATGRKELLLVMPVYNEEACIAGVVASWRDTLAGLGIDFGMIVLNDGSRDGTMERLARFRDDPRVEVVDKPNSGHGPTILTGYGMAVDRAEWVFQVDSDNEMPPAHFGALWARRGEFDALFGTRAGRVQGAGRKLISLVSRATASAMFGRGVTDVNTPYRLIRAGLLAPIVRAIPGDTFAPNILVSALLAAGGARILNLPVPHEGRKTGTVSIVRWRLWSAAFRAFRQIVRFRFGPKGRPAPVPRRDA